MTNRVGDSSLGSVFSVARDGSSVRDLANGLKMNGGRRMGSRVAHRCNKYNQMRNTSRYMCTMRVSL